MNNKIIALLLLFTSKALYGEAIIEEDWAWEISGGDMNYAATVNNNNHVLGQYCYIESGNCIYIFSVNASCEEGEIYPGLINSDVGSATIELLCSHKNETQHVYIISTFEDIDLIIKSANRVGIAFPLDNDRFQVSRFSLKGSTKAILNMRDRTMRMIDTNIKDQEYL